jgi:hypothetical protein
VRKQASYIDRKMAASGEREDDATMPLWLDEKPSKALSMRGTTRRSTSVVKAPKTLPESFTSLPEILAASQIRVIPNEPYDVGMGRFMEIMAANPVGWYQGMNRHAKDDREVIAKFGKSSANSNLKLALGYVDSKELSKDEMTTSLSLKGNLDNLCIMEKLHPMVYRLTIDREQLVDDDEELFKNVVLEVALSSRVVGSNVADYIGKTKVFFPKPHSKMVLYFILSK